MTQNFKRAHLGANSSIWAPKTSPKGPTHSDPKCGPPRAHPEFWKATRRLRESEPLCIENPVLGLCCHCHVGQCIEDILTERRLKNFTLSCRFALDLLCDKSDQQADMLPKPPLAPWSTATIIHGAPLSWPMGVQVGARPRGFPSHRSEAAHQNLALERNLPCPTYDSRQLLRLPRVTFLAGGWHLCARCRASGQNSSSLCSAAPCRLTCWLSFLLTSLWLVDDFHGPSLLVSPSPCR